MIVQQLPLSSDSANYRIATTLDDQVFIFDVYWNERDEAWFFDLRDADAELILGSVKIVLGTFLAGRCADERFPPGVLYAVDEAGTNQDAGIDDLGNRVNVFYLPITELE